MANELASISDIGRIILERLGQRHQAAQDVREDPNRGIGEKAGVTIGELYKGILDPHMIAAGGLGHNLNTSAKLATEGLGDLSSDFFRSAILGPIDTSKRTVGPREVITPPTETAKQAVIANKSPTSKKSPPPATLDINKTPMGRLFKANAIIETRLKTDREKMAARANAAAQMKEGGFVSDEGGVNDALLMSWVSQGSAAFTPFVEARARGGRGKTPQQEVDIAAAKEQLRGQRMTNVGINDERLKLLLSPDLQKDAGLRTGIFNRRFDEEKFNKLVEPLRNQFLTSQPAGGAGEGSTEDEAFRKTIQDRLKRRK